MPFAASCWCCQHAHFNTWQLHAYVHSIQFCISKLDLAVKIDVVVVFWLGIAAGELHAEKLVCLKLDSCSCVLAQWM